MNRIFLKQIIISFLVGIIIASSITVYAYSCIASEVKYIKSDGTEINVADALNDLYANKNKIEPLEMNFGTFEMGSRSGITDADLVRVTGLKNYKTLTIQCGGNMGTYISARVYIDNNLVVTISDTLEHEVNISNNNELKINFYSYNGLNNGSSSAKIKAE